MNNSGVNGVPGGPVNPFAGVENMTNPDAPASADELRNAQENVAQMRTDESLQTNGNSANSNNDILNNNLNRERNEKGDEEPSLAELRQAVLNGEHQDNEASKEMITDEEIDAPVESSPLEKEMAALEKTKAESQKKEAEDNENPVFKEIDEAAEAAKIERDVENYAFAKQIVKRLNPKNPAEMVEITDHARWEYMKRIFHRNRGDGLSGKAA